MAEWLNQHRITLDSAGYVKEDIQQSLMRKVRSAQANKVCFECATPNPSWFSANLGVLLCLTCAGEHRRVGVHISFVRSMDMDRLLPEHLVELVLGGNERARKAMGGAAGPGVRVSGQGLTSKYSTSTAIRYKHTLESEAKQYLSSIGVATQAGGANSSGESQGLSPTASQNNDGKLTEDSSSSDPSSDPLGAKNQVPLSAHTNGLGHGGSNRGQVAGYGQVPGYGHQEAGMYSSKAEIMSNIGPLSSVMNQPKSPGAKPAVGKPDGHKKGPVGKQADFDFDFD